MKKDNIPNPTTSEVDKTLEAIEEATHAEESERRRLGLTLEPEARRIPRDVHDVAGISPVEKEDGSGLGDYIKRWQDSNKFYLPDSIDVEKTKIDNTSDIEIPFNFVDYLVSKAKMLMTEKSLNIIDDIRQIKIKFIPKDKELMIMVKNNSNEIAVLSFQAEPPFSFIRATSHLGVHTF